MCSTNLHLACTISLIFILIVSVCRSVSANEVFTRVNTNEISWIANERLFFVTSEYGFVHDRKTGSPLQNEIPAEISGSKYETTPSTILMQIFATSEQDFRTLEGGLPGGKWVWILPGGVLGCIIASFIRQPLIGAIVGAIAVPLIGSMIYESDDFRLYVDNATDQDILLVIDSFSPIAVSQSSQIGVKFKEGSRSVKTVKASDLSELEHFDLQATRYRDVSGNIISGYYIYNVTAKNRYTIEHVVYTPEQ